MMEVGSIVLFIGFILINLWLRVRKTPQPDAFTGWLFDDPNWGRRRTKKALRLKAYEAVLINCGK